MLDDEAKYLSVHAGVRYWEDATVDGVEDVDGTLIPCRDGGLWTPIIRLEDGHIENWPSGVCANIYYKVCDQGEYFLLNDELANVRRWKGYYVPDEFLCHGDDSGYGDYIILDVDSAGFIKNWHNPQISEEDWV